MTPTRRRIPELFGPAGHFTAHTRARLDRSLARALGARSGWATALDGAVCEAARELRSEGLDDQAALDVLGALVEDAGRACGADRPSLLSGEPRWLPVRTQVIESARRELSGERAFAIGSVSSTDPLDSTKGP